MSKVAIKVEHLSKRYRLGEQVSYKTLREALPGSIRRVLFRTATSGNDTENTIWALRDVGFEVKQGEAVGIIGRNGAGKSTLLKILSRITEPTEGYVEIHGRAGSLLEIGTGFHAELTGRDNIYLNAAILGMKQREIQKKFDQIVAFSEIEKFIDTPVKYYSSGMSVRLAFSVAAHLDPEILIVDEVLAVGDLAFRRKCFDKMETVAEEGKTVLFVSHMVEQVQKLCSRVLVLKSGSLTVDSEPEKAIKQYLADLESTMRTQDLSERKRPPSLHPVIRKLELENSDAQPVHAIKTGDALKVKIHYEHSKAIHEPSFGLTFETENGIKIFSVETRVQKEELHDLPPKGVISCSIPRIPLLPGSYRINASCTSRTHLLDHVPHATRLEVIGADTYDTGRLPHRSQALVLVDADWEF
jgi:lipopolysaccharide transport system ATP-binding protein